VTTQRLSTLPAPIIMLLTFLCLSAFSLGAFADESPLPPGFTPAQAATAKALQEVLPALEAYHARTGSYPGPTRGLVPLPAFQESFPEVGLGESALRDGWGQPILVWSNGKAMGVVITGPDGEPGRDYTTWNPSMDVSGDDEVMILGQVGRNAPPAAPGVAAGQRFRAFAEMRALGTVLEALPAAEKRLIDTKGEVASVGRLKAHLVPAYLTKLTTVDPWGRPYLYWSDGDGYRLVSYGQDGKPDSSAAFAKVRGGRASAPPQRDIVFSAGSFVYSD